MNAAHLHLLLNHIPVLGVGFGILLLSYGSLKKSDTAKQLALFTFILCGIIAVPVFLTGEPAEEIVKNHPSINRDAIESHEDFAKTALISIEILAAVSIFSLFCFRKRNIYAAWSLLAVFLVAFCATAMMARTAYLGGMIHHSEISESGTTVQPSSEGD